MAQEDRWVSVGRDLSWSVSTHVHAVRPGAVTSACGCTALPASTWRRPNTHKPKCPSCLRKLEEEAES